MYTVQRLVGLVFAVLFVGSTGAQAQRSSNDLEGTWRMVFQELVYPGSVVDQSGG